MQACGKFVLAMMGAVTLFVALAEPAEARRRIRFGSFGGFGGSSGYGPVRRYSDSGWRPGPFRFR